jgi:hypothetical protein
MPNKDLNDWQGEFIVVSFIECRIETVFSVSASPGPARCNDGQREIENGALAGKESRAQGKRFKGK